MLKRSVDEVLALGTSSGTFTAPDGGYGTHPLRPGLSYTFEVKAYPGDRLSLVSMFGMSNDWFFATAPEGLALFDAASQPITGDVTAMVHLYDLGTELSEGPTDRKVREVSPSMYSTPVARHLKLPLSL
jgi:hypothetical protein